MYKSIIPEFTRIIFFYKRNINNDFNNFESIINAYNNCYISEQNNIKLIDIYNNNHITYSLSQITYFKKFIEIILKYRVYTQVAKKFKIYKSHNQLKNNNELLKINLTKILLNNKNVINYFNNKEMI